MSKLIVLIMTFAGIIAASAQQPSPSPSVPPLPEGPLLNRTPGFSRWTVVTTSANSQPTPEPGSPGTAKAPPASRVTFTKTGSIVLEEVPGHQIWHFGNTKANIYPENPLPVLSSGFDANDFSSIDFTRGDFAGLDWVSEQSYKGMATLRERKCLVFEGRILPWTSTEMQQLESKARKIALDSYVEKQRLGGPVVPFEFQYDRSLASSPARVYIDLETRLPILLVFGKDMRQKCEYFYQSPPATPLVLPPILFQAAAQQEQRSKDLVRRPARP